MRAWQIFVVGTAILIAALLFPVFQSSLPAAVAVGLIVVVLFGFLLRPRKEAFILKTTVSFFDALGRRCIQNDQIAVKIELIRLWMLFIPTFAAVAFLIAQSVHESRWALDLLDDLPSNALLLMLIWRAGIILCVFVVAIISTWISERWVLRDANACSARSYSVYAGRINYAFLDPKGEFYGGDGVLLGGKQPLQLATIVLYRVDRPEFNKLGMGCMFHKLVIVGHGVNDLDKETVKRLRRAEALKAAAG